MTLGFAACGNRETGTSGATYRDALSQFRGQHYQQALATTAQGLRTVSRGSAPYWDLRLLTAQIHIAKRDALSAKKALEFELPPEFSSHSRMGRFWFCQGFVASLERNPDLALRRLQSAAGEARAAADGELLAEIQNRQGAVEVDLQRFQDADGHLREALEYSTRRSVQWLAVSVISNLGYRYMRERRYEDAIPHYVQAAETAHRLGVVETEARSRGNLGNCYYRIGDLDRALTSLQQAEASFQSTGNRAEQKTWLGVIGNIYLARNDYRAAANYYKRALDIARGLGDQGAGDAASWLTNLSRVLIEDGDLDAAEGYNNQALALKRESRDRAATAYSELNAAKIATARGHYREAEKIVREIIRSAIDDPPPLLRAHEQLAIILTATHRYQAAEAEFRSTIREIESERNQLRKDDSRLAYLSTLIGFYQDFIWFLMERGKTIEALEVADSSHARTMMERLGLRHARATHTDFQKLASASGSTLMVYSLGLLKSYLWIVTPAAIKAVELPPQERIRPLIEAWDKSIQDLRDPMKTPDEPGRKLYETLIAPAAGAIAQTGRVIVVPDGLLYSLNLETLPVPGDKPHYWIEDVTISIAPSLGLLSMGAGKDAVPGSLLLIGNPVSPDPGFPNLAFAQQEMVSIEKNLPAVRTVTLKSAEARPDKWVNSQPANYDLIHFTAHATASREEPLESAIILSRGANGAYRLHARDVMQTPLKAQLVTISACRSAGTRIYSGEGLVGLAWAFLQSGARNVIAGLWDVSDESGARAMATLYKGLAAGRTPADSLRDAKLELIHSGGIYRKPWYWGPFQLFTTVFTPVFTPELLPSAR